LIANLQPLTKDAWWVYLLGLLISTRGGKLIWAGVKSLKAKLRVRRFHAGIEATAKVYHTLNDLVARTGASRAIILRAENGGGIPTPGRSLYTTIIQEAYSSRSNSIRDSWHRRRADGPYVDLLRQIIQHGEVAIRLDAMDVGELRDLYEANDVKRSQVHMLGSNGHFMAYLSVNFKEDAELTAKQRVAIADAASYLRAVLAKHEEVFQVRGDVGMG
jgi:hypothetical protein